MKIKYQQKEHKDTTAGALNPGDLFTGVHKCNTYIMIALPQLKANKVSALLLLDRNETETQGSYTKAGTLVELNPDDSIKRLVQKSELIVEEA